MEQLYLVDFGFSFSLLVTAVPLKAACKQFHGKAESTPGAHQKRKWGHKCRPDKIPKGIKIKFNYRDQLFQINEIMLIGNMKLDKGFWGTTQMSFG